MRWSYLFVLAACGGGSVATPVPAAKPIAPVPAPAPPARVDGTWQCTRLPFAESTPVPEASAAAWMTIDGARALVVTSDSGNDGAYGIVDPETGATRETGVWPLGAAGDDVEGLATYGDRLYGLTSGGWMRAWERRDHGFALVDGPYPIGDRDGPDICGPKQGNCKRDFEGLCLAAHPRGPCVGFALAKADGKLRCLVRDGAGRLALTPLAIDVGPPAGMADCAFDDTDGLWVGGNLFDFSRVHRVVGWEDPATAKDVPIAALGVGFPEVIAVRGDVVYRMSDTGGAPSRMAKFRCRPDER